MSIRIRPAKVTDQAFIQDAWKRSFEGSPAVRGADREHYRNEMERTIARLCARATVLVACDVKDEDTLVGFAVYSSWKGYAGNELHYVYVKKDFRGHRIASDLLKDANIKAYTFATMSARAPKDWVYTPRFTI